MPNSVPDIGKQLNVLPIIWALISSDLLRTLHINCQNVEWDGCWVDRIVPEMMKMNKERPQDHRICLWVASKKHGQAYFMISEYTSQATETVRFDFGLLLREPQGHKTRTIRALVLASELKYFYYCISQTRFPRSNMEEFSATKILIFWNRFPFLLGIEFTCDAFNRCHGRVYKMYE